ncbi:hypothetical protein LEP1GSC151_0946 [Leptospira interrogans serovar Grippotyphosa str. LT2186]|uniref:Uncharacterized protein n=1 Tax=Leptospira interrogans serovar Grippotyphosa str. LT2186 TaxID=1001599 RepID=M3HJ20_LEPIR|nr:hypothetical protein LEP1GSC151_0946 [Leptospira interrogans serovar Grippotyphosa str. LT2186]
MEYIIFSKRNDLWRKFWNLFRFFWSLERIESIRKTVLESTTFRWEKSN